MAQACGVAEVQLLKRVNMADLVRIAGVGGESSELLEAARVDTVEELRHRKADTLAAGREEVNAAPKPVRQGPSVKQVTRWIEQAKSVPPPISH